MSMWGTAILAVVAFTIGNFVFQALGSSDWETAFDRSFFQAVAIIGYVWIWGS